jgi:hypothetical protein
MGIEGMLATLGGNLIACQEGQWRDQFDREPFGFDHRLHEVDLFDFEQLRRLSRLYLEQPRDSYVAAGAPSPDVAFYSLPTVSLSVHEAMDRIDTGSYRLLMKRPEQRDPRYRELLDAVFKEVIAARGGLAGETVVRLDSTILVSSSTVTTPFHFDPEIGFFAQIEGDKTYHLFAPDVLTEPELERFYMRNQIDIGQVALAARQGAREYVFQLGPGKGLHQPQDAPHWVETKGTRSISYSFVFETDRSRARGRTRTCNHYLRKIGLQPRRPGAIPTLDAMKAHAMAALLPVRSGLRSALRH